MKITRWQACVALLFSLVLPLEAVPVEAYRSYITGLMALRKGDVASALQDYQKVILLDKDAIPVYRDMIFVFWQAGMHEEALTGAKRLEEACGDDLSTQLLLGNFYLFAGQPESARQAWEKALKIEPENETALLYLAAYHASGADAGQAIAYWKKYLAQQPDSAEGYYQMGVVQEKTGSEAEAMASLRKAIALKPGLSDAHIALAQLYEKSGQMLAAAAEYEQYVKLVPDNSTILFYLGGLYYRMKNFSAAEDTFTRVRELNPKDYHSLFWLAIIAEEKKDWARAIQYLEDIRKQEESALILTRLSYYYSLKKEYCTAIKYLKRAAKLDAQNATAYYLLGLAYLDDGKPRAAEKALRQALALKPSMEEARFHLAVLYERQKKNDKAVREIQAILAASPDNPPALNFLGYTYADHGIRLEEAAGYVTRAIAAEPDNGTYLDSLGWVHFKMGRFEEAEQELARAVEKYPDPVIWEHLGDVLVKRGKAADAWEAYQQALGRDPSNKTVRKKVRAMEKLVLPGTLQRKLLKRAAGNLLQISSLRLNFSAQGHADEINFRIVGVFQYVRPELWRVDLLGNFMAPQIVVIRTAGGVQVYPAAAGGNVSPENLALFDQVRDLLSARLLDAFDGDKVSAVSRGRNLLYSAGDKSLLVDRENATVQEYSVKGKFTVRFRRHVREEGLNIPAEIEMYSPAGKTATTIKLRNFILNQKVDDSVFTMQQQ